jgi:hypothetical protein
MPRSRLLLLIRSFRVDLIDDQGAQDPASPLDGLLDSVCGPSREECFLWHGLSGLHSHSDSIQQALLSNLLAERHSYLSFLSSLLVPDLVGCRGDDSRAAAQVRNLDVLRSHRVSQVLLSLLGQDAADFAEVDALELPR